MTQALFYPRSPCLQGILRVFLAALLVLARPVRAQEQQFPRQIPTFKAASNTVVLDLVVTDKKNRVINDLGCDDFAVYENEIVQEIQSCQKGRREARGAQDAADTTTPEPAKPAHIAVPKAPAPEPNFIVFLIDYSTTEFENQRLVQDAALHYVNERMGANDQVAVFFLGSGFRFLQGFTQDREKLTAVLRGRDVSATAIAAGSGIRPSGAADSSVLADAGSLPASSGSGPGAGQAAAAAGAAAAANSQVFINARIQAALTSMRSAISSRTARGVLVAIEAISGAVAPIGGRKTMILFSQGFVVGPHMEPELARTVDAANRANVAIYTIDSSGLAPRDVSAALIPQDRLAGISARAGRGRIPASGGESLFDRARTAGSDSHESSLRYVAAATGGLAFRNTNDLAQSLDRVVEDIHSHFILSYQPRNQDFDGEFRSIRVEVKKPGLVVRTRSGYYAIPAGTEGVSGEEYRLLQTVRTKSVPSLPFDAVLSSFPTREGTSRVSITVELSGDEVTFRQSGEARVAALTVIGLLRGEEGYVFSRVGTPVNVKATEEEYKALQKGSLSFSNIVEVPPGRYSFEVLVMDQNSGKAAIRNYSLTVAPQSAKLFSSSVVLSSEIRKAQDTSSQSYLSFGQVRVLPSARRQFRNGENLVYFFCVYNARLSAKRANLEVQTVLERPGRPPVPLSTARAEQVVEDDSSTYIPIARYITLDGLAPGHYFLRVDVEDLKSGQACVARTSFEVLP